MTLLIAFVEGADEARDAAQGGAAIVETVSTAAIGELRAAVAGRADVGLALRAGGDEAAFLRALERAADADRVAVGFVAAGDEDVRRALPPLAVLPFHVKRAAVFFADRGLAGLPLAAVREAGFAELVIDLDDAGQGGLLRHVPFSRLREIAEGCRALGIGIGFGGGLEAPDVTRLAPLRPASLRFDAALRREGRIDRVLVAGIAALLAPPEGPDRGGTVDRILVRDMVVDMAVGAYSRERGRRQKVRFTVEADVRRAGTAPAGMGEVYSYDLITDAIGTLGQGAHVNFVETLAEDLAAIVLADARVASVLVRVEKLDLGSGAVGIEIRRGK